MSPEIHFDDTFLSPWLAEQIQIPYVRGAMPCIVRVRQGKVLGGVLFTDYTGTSINMHVRGFVGNWINRDMLWVCFHYPFEQLGVKRIFGKVEAANKRALDFDRNLGFREIATIPDVYPSGAMVVMSMCRHECRWLDLKPKSLAARGQHGWQIESSASA